MLVSTLAIHFIPMSTSRVDDAQYMVFVEIIFVIEKFYILT